MNEQSVLYITDEDDSLDELVSRWNQTSARLAISMGQLYEQVRKNESIHDDDAPSRYIRVAHGFPMADGIFDWLVDRMSGYKKTPGAFFVSVDYKMFQGETHERWSVAGIHQERRLPLDMRLVVEERRKPSNLNWRRYGQPELVSFEDHIQLYDLEENVVRSRIGEFLDRLDRIDVVLNKYLRPPIEPTKGKEDPTPLLPGSVCINKVGRHDEGLCTYCGQNGEANVPLARVKCDVMVHMDCMVNLAVEKRPDGSARAPCGTYACSHENYIPAGWMRLYEQKPEQVPPENKPTDDDSNNG